jgi:AcrR family transcriptional regulator
MAHAESRHPRAAECRGPCAPVHTLYRDPGCMQDIFIIAALCRIFGEGQVNLAAEPSGKRSGRTYQSMRRTQAAADTREMILTTAMRLFLEHGYGKVTVNDIAREASIAVPTVYASTGGKSAILGALIDQAMRDPIVDATLTAVSQCRTPRDIMRVTTHGIRVDNERYHEMMQVMEAAAPFDEAVTRILARSDEGYRQALAHVVRSVEDMQALKPGLTSQQAIDMLWFYLGRGAWRVLVSDRQWTWDQAEQWLAGQVSMAVLDPEWKEELHHSRLRRAQRSPQGHPADFAAALADSDAALARWRCRFGGHLSTALPLPSP